MERTVMEERPNPATTSWLFRAFGETSVHGLCDNLVLGSTALSQDKRAVAWGPASASYWHNDGGAGARCVMARMA
jgi:hypothetical protein